MTGLLDSKVALITGAGGGIGQATALAFAEEGAAVVANDLGCARDGTGQSPQAADAVVHAIESAGGRAVAHYDSVATPEGASSAVARAVEAFGRLDVLVHAAGVMRDKTLGKMEPDVWSPVVDAGLYGTLLTIRAAAAQFRAQGSGGRIVVTTAVAGMLGNFGQANSAAASAGTYGVMRTASIELQKDGITVNAVAPIAKTRLTEDLPMFEQVDSMRPEHVAPAYVFLASDACGETSGQVLAVAGGKMSVYKVVESAGRFKDTDDGIWTAAEIAEHWSAIKKLGP